MFPPVEDVLRRLRDVNVRCPRGNILSALRDEPETRDRFALSTRERLHEMHDAHGISLSVADHVAVVRSSVNAP